MSPETAVTDAMDYKDRMVNVWVDFRGIIGK
jgi:hypothetical protein